MITHQEAFALTSGAALTVDGIALAELALLDDASADVVGQCESQASFLDHVGAFFDVGADLDSTQAACRSAASSARRFLTSPRVEAYLDASGEWFLSSDDNAPYPEHLRHEAAHIIQVCRNLRTALGELPALLKEGTATHVLEQVSRGVVVDLSQGIGRSLPFVLAGLALLFLARR